MSTCYGILLVWNPRMVLAKGKNTKRNNDSVVRRCFGPVCASYLRRDSFEQHDHVQLTCRWCQAIFFIPGIQKTIRYNFPKKQPSIRRLTSTSKRTIYFENKLKKTAKFSAGNCVCGIRKKKLFHANSENKNKIKEYHGVVQSYTVSDA